MRKLLIFLILVFSSSVVYSSEFKELAGSAGSLMVKDPNGKVLFSVNPDKKLVPASTLKVLTSLCALETLGPDFRFKTEFYLSSKRDLVIKGYGDPLLISEVMERAASFLSKKLKGTAVRDIISDGSYFEKNLIIPGVTKNSSQPYDAPNGAICSNFNTVFFKKVNGRFVTGESQTPLLSFVKDRIRKRKVKSGRVKLTAKESAIYTGHLFRYFLEKRDIKIKGDVVRKNVVIEKKDLIYTYYSEFSLKEIIKKLMEYSNNFTANQIFITLGIKKYGPPGNLEKGRTVLKDYMKKRGYSVDIVEGSGISRGNRISARELLKIVIDFSKFHTLLKNEGDDYFKTGTMSDISSRAGFIKKGDKLFSYVVIINGKDAYTRQLKILRLIRSRLVKLIH